MPIIQKVLGTDFDKKEIRVVLSQGSFCNSDLKEEFKEIKTLANLKPNAQYDGFKLMRDDMYEGHELATLFFSDLIENTPLIPTSDTNVDGKMKKAFKTYGAIQLVARLFLVITIVLIGFIFLFLIAAIQGFPATGFIEFSLRMSVPFLIYSLVLFTAGFVYRQKNLVKVPLE